MTLWTTSDQGRRRITRPAFQQPFDKKNTELWASPLLPLNTFSPSLRPKSCSHRPGHARSMEKKVTHRESCGTAAFSWGEMAEIVSFSVSERLEHPDDKHPQATTSKLLCTTTSQTKLADLVAITLTRLHRQGFPSHFSLWVSRI